MDEDEDDLENYVKPKTDWKEFFKEALHDLLGPIFMVLLLVSVVGAFFGIIWLASSYPYYGVPLIIVVILAGYFTDRYNHYRADVNWKAKCAAREEYWEKKRQANINKEPS